MKNFIKSFIVFVTLFASFQLTAQEKEPENSLLWEISGNGLTKTSYLYGTIHIICAPDFFLNDKTKKAFDTAEKLVLEVNLSDPNEMMVAQNAAMGKEPLSKQLSAGELSRLSAILQKTTGMTIDQVDNFSLSTVMSLIMVKSFDCSALKFYEMEFMEMAKTSEISVSGLESMQSQLDMFDNAYTNAEMLEMMEQSTSEVGATMISMYKNENIAALFEMSTDEKFMSDTSRKFMLDNRNKSWVAILPKLMTEKKIFIAVGAAHLAGEFGVINILRNQGYIVKPVLE